MLNHLGRHMPQSVAVLSVPEDAPYVEALEKQLTGLTRSGRATLWHQGTLPPGAMLRDEMAKAIRRATVAILFVSPASLANTMLWNLFEEARAYAKQGRTIILPIVVRATNLTDTWLQTVQCLPRNGRPVTDSTHDPDSIWKDIAAE